MSETQELLKRCFEIILTPSKKQGNNTITLRWWSNELTFDNMQETKDCLTETFSRWLWIDKVFETMMNFGPGYVFYTIHFRTTIDVKETLNGIGIFEVQQ